MAEDHDTRLDRRALFDVPSEACADRALIEPRVPERVALDRCLRVEAFDLHRL